MGAFTYPRSEPGSSGHLDLVEALNAMSPALRRELDALSEAALTYRTAEGEWSIKEVCGHLRDDAQFFHQRLFAMINMEEPRLEAWDQEMLVRERNPQAAPIDELLAEFSAQRGATVEMLADLVHWNWARQGRHAELGRVSIRQQVERKVRHDEAHLEQIRGLKVQAESGVAPPPSQRRPR